MAKTKSAGSTKLGRDSQPQYLGVKVHDGGKVNAGMIIVRQRGTKFLPGENVKKGKDDTLYAVKNGVVRFITKKKRKFDGTKKVVKMINVKEK